MASCADGKIADIPGALHKKELSEKQSCEFMGLVLFSLFFTMLARASGGFNHNESQLVEQGEMVKRQEGGPASE